MWLGHSKQDVDLPKTGHEILWEFLFLASVRTPLSEAPNSLPRNTMYFTVCLLCPSAGSPTTASAPHHLNIALCAHQGELMTVSESSKLTLPCLLSCFCGVKNTQSIYYSGWNIESAEKIRYMLHCVKFYHKLICYHVKKSHKYSFLLLLLLLYPIILLGNYTYIFQKSHFFLGWFHRPHHLCALTPPCTDFNYVYGVVSYLILYLCLSSTRSSSWGMSFIFIIAVSPVSTSTWHVVSTVIIIHLRDKCIPHCR